MTKITSIAIPPSLLSQYLKVLRPVNRYDITDTIVQLNGHVRNPPFKDNRPIALQRAHIAADWLADRHIPNSSSRARLDWKTARINEILARDFSAPYWSPATVISDLTENAIPSCVLDVDGVAPAYQDPARRASWCVYRFVDSSYATPVPETSPPNPSAGWYGEVVTAQYQDVWLAQRRWEFQFPTNIGTSTDTPVWADISWTHDMSATFRGNKLWPSVTICPLTSPSLPLFGAGFEPVRAFLKNEFMYPLPINPESPPWSQSISQSIALDLRFADPLSYYSSATYFVLYICPIPSHGRYFARNDSVQVWLTATADAYYATGP